MPMAGSQARETPTYSATTGKLWLEKGGVYVLANIRGGGEFGPEVARGRPRDQAAAHL